MPEPRITHYREWKRLGFPATGVYIGRAVARARVAASRWANPFRFYSELDRPSAVALFDEWVRNSQEERAVWIREHAEELLGAEFIVCWCQDEAHPNRPCHGEPLLQLAKETRERRLHG